MDATEANAEVAQFKVRQRLQLLVLLRAPRMIRKLSQVIYGGHVRYLDLLRMVTILLAVHDVKPLRQIIRNTFLIIYQNEASGRLQAYIVAGSWAGACP